MRPITPNHWLRTCLAGGSVAALLATFLVLPPRDVRAAALDPDSCAKLQGELESLEKAGLKDLLAKGAEWGKANLAPGKLQEIKRYIEVDEQLLFRCPGRHLVNLPLDPDPPPPAADDKKTGKDAGPKADGKADAAASPKADKKAPAEKRPPQKAKGKPKSAAADDDETASPAKAQPKPQPKPRARPKPADDAFKPPPSDPDNPFGFQQ